MILGIGTDILNAHQLAESSLSPSDPFLRKTYTEREIEEAAAAAIRTVISQRALRARKLFLKLSARILTRSGFVRLRSSAIRTVRRP